MAQQIAYMPSYLVKTPPQEYYIYEDEKCISFDEKNSPQAMVHFLIVPKMVIPRFRASTEEDDKALGHLLVVANNLAYQKGLPHNGYHVIIDEDFSKKQLKALHVFGRALHHMVWPMGPGCRI